MTDVNVVGVEKNRLHSLSWSSMNIDVKTFIDTMEVILVAFLQY
jgi:hypothetical protein